METTVKKQAEMTDYVACSIIEGFCGYEPKPNEIIRAWAHLIKTGACWRLQGWYGRNASTIIGTGVISEDGKINWKRLKELRQSE